MIHQEAQALIEAYIDNELGTETSIALLEHVSSCAVCNTRLKESLVMKEQLSRSKALHYNLPDHLKSRVLSSASTKPIEPLWKMPLFGWSASIATSLAIGVLAGIFLFTHPQASVSDTDELIWDHIHALKSSHLIDVASSDKHTVKPWFAGKTDFSPVVIDLAAYGFPLLGARAQHLGDKDIAALVYSNGKHYIGLYEEVGDSKKEDKPHTFRGYNTISFTVGEIEYTAVSDATAEELQKFKTTFLNEK